MYFVSYDILLKEFGVCNHLNRLYENPVSIKDIAALLLSVTFRLKKEGKMTYMSFVDFMFGQALDMYAVFTSILYCPPAFSKKKHPCGSAALNLGKAPSLGK